MLREQKPEKTSTKNRQVRKDLPYRWVLWKLELFSSTWCLCLTFPRLNSQIHRWTKFERMGGLCFFAVGIVRCESLRVHACVRRLVVQSGENFFRHDDHTTLERTIQLTSNSKHVRQSQCQMENEKKPTLAMETAIKWCKTIPTIEQSCYNLESQRRAKTRRIPRHVCMRGFCGWFYSLILIAVNHWRHASTGSRIRKEKDRAKERKKKKKKKKKKTKNVNSRWQHHVCELSDDRSAKVNKSVFMDTSENALITWCLRALKICQFCVFLNLIWGLQKADDPKDGRWDDDEFGD
mgnify:CR=1 FL=1